MKASVRQKVTSHDVAREAGVSRTTVSMVLSGSTAVVLADETRLRVKQAAERLGYRPNSAGRMLASGASKTIGLIVSNPDLLLVDGFIPPTLYAISKIAAGHGYNVLVESLPEETNDRAFSDLVLTRRIDGMIVLNPRTEDPAAILRDMEAGLDSEALKKTLVIQDREQAIKTAVRLAGDHDIILVAGKGHEKYQDVQGVKHPFDDKQVLFDIMKNQ